MPYATKAHSWKAFNVEQLADAAESDNVVVNSKESGKNIHVKAVLKNGVKIVLAGTPALQRRRIFCID